jgi:hypothetical protein
MVGDREKLSSVLDSTPQKSVNLARIFKNVFNNCKNAGLCYQPLCCVNIILYLHGCNLKLSMHVSSYPIH